MIPYEIHQFWMGEKMPEQHKKWVQSVIDCNPEAKHKLWNEEEVLINHNTDKFTEAWNCCNTISEKSDLARWSILYNRGGIYLDTDIECFHPLGWLIARHEAVTCQYDNHHSGLSYPIPCFVACSQFHPMPLTCLKACYDRKDMKELSDEKYGVVLHRLMNTPEYSHVGHPVHLYPNHIAYPYPVEERYTDKGDIGPKNLTDPETRKGAYMAHHWEGSWSK